MIVIWNSMLDSFRSAGRCEYCKRRSARLDASHIWSKGAGQVDIPGNIVGLCRWCHSASHNANDYNDAHPNHDDLVTIASKREKWSAQDIEDAVMRLRADDRVKVLDLDQRVEGCECRDDQRIQVGRDTWACLGCGEIL